MNSISTSEPSLPSRAMLCSLSISMWSARKHDPEASEEIAQRHGAQPDAGRYHKVLPQGGARRGPKDRERGPSGSLLHDPALGRQRLSRAPSRSVYGPHGENAAALEPVHTSHRYLDPAVRTAWRKPGYGLAVCSVRRIIRLPRNFAPSFPSRLK